MVNVKDPGLLKNFNANNEENSENDEEESEIIFLKTKVLKSGDHFVRENINKKINFDA